MAYQLTSALNITIIIKNLYILKEPVKKVLGKHRKVCKRNNKKRIVEVEDAFYYIPILLSLQQQLSSPRLLLMIMTAEAQLHQGNNAIFTDFCDGTLFKEHPMFSSDEKALQLLLYYDDVNVCNPLTNKPHKLCLFYYQLANIVPIYRSKLRSIKLFAVCSYKTFKRYKEKAMQEILEPLVSDVQLLGRDDGYTFTTSLGQVKLRGAVLAFLADTPASHASAGFKEGVGGARRKCRHCMATFDSMQEYFEEELFELRDKDTHEEHLCSIENAPSQYLRQYFSKEYGINQRSVLCKLPYFDITKQLPQDIMHIFLEGILEYEIKLCLNYLIKDQQVITLDKLNYEIKHFPLGYTDEKNRPILIKESDLDMKSSSNLGQTASRMWLLSQMLPFVLENCINVLCPQWNSFMTLQEIMSLVFCSEISQASILYLKSTVKRYLSNFKATYNHMNIIPKQHYLVHLPTQMLNFGPVIRCWCMRFEGKHAYFKDLAKKIRNFKNIPYSLATRNQQMESANFIQIGDNQPDMHPWSKEDIRFGNYTVLRGNHAVDAESYISRFYDIHLDLHVQSIFQCNQIEIYGTKYKPGLNNFLLFSLDDAGFPLFGCLKKIWFIEDNGCYFVMEVFNTINFNENLNAFKIEAQELASGYEIASHSQLKDHHVYHSYRRSNERFVVTRANVLACE